MVEGKDFYYENGYRVFTENYHLKRGFCCDNNCRHCPWKKPENTILINGDISEDLIKEILIKELKGMFRVCTDMVKTDAADIEQEKLDNEYNLALTNVLKLLNNKLK